jgi:uncharacterized membrane protein
LLAAVAACATPPLFGPPTGAICPTTTPPTYADFAQPFMAAYCTRCHASTLPPDQRHGAPTFHDFDTEFGIVAVANHIDETAAAGPAATNTSMPFDGAQPTLDERRRLGEYLACASAK